MPYDVAHPFAATKKEVTDDQDADAAARQEFGHYVAAADWEDLEAYYHEVGKERFCEALRLTGSTEGSPNSSLVVGRWRSTTHLGGGSGRKYFLQRFDGKVRGGWAVHAEYGNRTCCLGSWSPIKGRVAVNLRKGDAASVDIQRNSEAI